MVEVLTLGGSGARRLLRHRTNRDGFRSMASCARPYGAWPKHITGISPIASTGSSGSCAILSLDRDPPLHRRVRRQHTTMLPSQGPAAQGVLARMGYSESATGAAPTAALLRQSMARGSSWAKMGRSVANRRYVCPGAPGAAPRLPELTLGALAFGEDHGYIPGLDLLRELAVRDVPRAALPVLYRHHRKQLGVD